MTPAHIAALIEQLGSGQDLADRANAHDPNLRLDRNTISRHKRDAQSPALRAELAYAAVWLDAGYPCTANDQPATLTTNSPASSYGLPVVVIDGAPHGSADVAALDLGDCPEPIREAAIRAGYVVS